jgi:hypothetical protein
MDITNAEFDALVGDLLTTLDSVRSARAVQVVIVVELHEARHRRKTIITIRKGGANDDEEDRDIGRGDGICPDSFRRDGLL